MMRLNVKAFGLTCGLIWGFGLFLVTWWIIIREGSSAGTTFIGRVYWGYEITPLGSLIGLAWALVDGCIGGVVFAWLYNLIAGKMQHGEGGQ